MRIFIIRHGDPDYAADSLTEKGQREAELLSCKLVNEHINAVYLSPLGRAQLTAYPTLNKLGIEGITLEWLKEFPIPLKKPFKTKYSENVFLPYNMPPLEWTTIENIYDPIKWREADIYKNTGIVDEYDHICNEFDKLIASYGFIKNAGFYKIKDGYENSTDTIAFFCHLGLGNLLLSHIMGMSLPVVWHTLFLPTSSVTTIYMEMHRDDLQIAQARIISIGDTSHLYAGGEPISPSGLHTDKIR